MADVVDQDVWPPKHEGHVWDYTPCPWPPEDESGRVDPLVSSRWLLHRWHHPDHFIPVKDHERRYLDNLWLHWIQRRTMPLDGEVGNEDQLAPYYVFSAVPKKRGDPLRLHSSTISRHPTGWGLLVEEGFRISWAFIALFVLWIIFGLVFSIIWMAKHGGINAGGWNVWSISAYFTGVAALVSTVWIARAKEL